MKERQRWQPEEDALLRAYVKQYGPKEWNLISQRMGKPLLRDSKSCLERWKNYLKPGIKKGSLTLEEQNLVISLQSKYGNKWKKIASLVPGRTAKRLGKWWEVFKEKQLKLKNSTTPQIPPSSSTAAITTGSSSITNEVEKNSSFQGKYDHILETFAEKYVQPKLLQRLQQQPTVSQQSLDFHSPHSVLMPNLSLGCCSVSTINDSTLAAASSSSSVLPPWMSTPNMGTSSLSSSSSTTPSPSVSLTLSSSEPPPPPPPPPSVFDLGTQFLSLHQMGMLVQYCRELEERRQNWVQHKKEANWRLSRLEQQLEAEKARKRREIMEEFESKFRCLREEEMSYFERIESECRDQLSAIQRDAEIQEAKMVEIWCSKHVKLAKIVECMRGSIHHQHFN
ncbi:SANT/Myb domain [Macleaya cordata]|uniref:SANT/Myb domain n=1 Tax=Macleaya cordata TaxID=56857 RepID=A0A200R095_MACCD|nr:SANT/Myb domain [Macleaya cordata]